MAAVLVSAPAGDRLAELLRARGVDVRDDAREADSLVTVPPPVRLEPLADIDPAEWKERFRLWTEEPFAAAQAWLRRVLARGAPGRWVAVTSHLGVQAFPSGGAVGAAVAALHTLVKIAAVEYGARGIRANAVAVGWKEDSPLPADARALAAADTPTGRLATDDDVAACVAWLLADAPEQVNGEVLRLDGGYTITRGSAATPYEESARWLLDDVWR